MNEGEAEDDKENAKVGAWSILGISIIWTEGFSSQSFLKTDGMGSM